MQPAAYAYPSGSLIKEPHRKGFLLPYVLPYIAGLFPSDVDIEIVEETVQDIDFSEQYDLVCISVLSLNVKRAYEIADIFRGKKVPVVMGGYHVNLCPDEAQAHADAVILGEIELVFNDFLSDLRQGRLKPRYTAQGRFNMRSMPFPRHDLFHYEKYNSFLGTRVPLSASRGCPNQCGFCSTPQVFPGGIIYRPPEEVVEEIKKVLVDCTNIQSPVFVFVDDNMTANFSRLEALLLALIPLKIRWAGFVTTQFCLDQAMVRLARRSGCYAVFMGLESINQGSLNQMNKRFNQAQDFPKIVKAMVEHRIFLSTGIVLGLPQDNETTLRQTARFLIDNSVTNAFINPAYPFPYSPFYNELKAKGLLYDERFWLKVYNPFGIFRNDNFSSPEHFASVFKEITGQFLSFNSILKRSWAYKRSFFPLLAYNLAHKRMAQKNGIQYVSV